MQVIHHWSSQNHPDPDIHRHRLQGGCRRHYIFPSTSRCGHKHQYLISSSAWRYLLQVLFVRNGPVPRSSSTAKAPTHLVSPIADRYFLLWWSLPPVAAILI